jgi:MFS family permease
MAETSEDVATPRRSALLVAGPLAFGVLFALESLARSILATVLPLEAYHLLGNARDVSVLYTLAGLASASLSQFVPFLIRRIGPRRAYIATASALGLVPLIIAVGTVPTLAMGLVGRTVASAGIAATMNLYIMATVAKRDLVRSEPLRLFCSAASWAIGPTLGVFLFEHVSPLVSLGTASLFAFALVAYILALGLGDGRERKARADAGLVRNVGRFFRQPRLRLAWSLAMGRSAWWSMFFVYAPLVVVRAGYGDVAAAMLVSAGNALLVLAPAWSRIARRVGVRPMIVGAFLGMAGLTVLAGLADLRGAPGLLPPALLFCGALGATMLDALASIAFLRAVHPYERAEMATVYGTYRDVADLVPPAIYSVILTFLPLPVLFVANGLAMLVFARLALHLPRRI